MSAPADPEPRVTVTAPGPPRRVPLDGAANFRDLGGYETADGRRVRFGHLYRSGVLSELTDGDVSILAELGIATVVDLRGHEEVNARPDRLPAGVSAFHVPVHDVSASPMTIAARLAAGDTVGLGAQTLIEGNRAFADRLCRRFAEVLRVVMHAPHRPVVMHCTAGKDRAGFASAVVLLTLGVSVDRVIDDYLLTNACLAARHARILEEAGKRVSDLEPLREMLQVRSEYLQAGLDAMLERSGSFEAYVRDVLGVDDADREQFRAQMLEG